MVAIVEETTIKWFNLYLPIDEDNVFRVGLCIYKNGKSVFRCGCRFNGKT